jgi:hypothetical protein
MQGRGKGDEWTAVGVLLFGKCPVSCALIGVFERFSRFPEDTEQLHICTIQKKTLSTFRMGQASPKTKERRKRREFKGGAGGASRAVVPTPLTLRFWSPSLCLITPNPAPRPSPLTVTLDATLISPNPHSPPKPILTLSP